MVTTPSIGRTRLGAVLLAAALLSCGALATTAYAGQQRGATPPAAAPTTPAQTPTPGRAQGPGTPGQRAEWLWWNDEGVKKDLGLTPTQVKKISDIYEKRLAEIKPFADELTKQQDVLNKLVRERQVSDTEIALQAAHVEALVSPIAASRIVMSYRIYRVLSVQQNDLLKAAMDKHRAGRGGH
jgi:Spy/CpxP family protein refolding chaperone